VKILVVEDETRIAHSIKRGLEFKSHVVDVAENGELGLELASQQDYDVIILDRMLPIIDGMAVCQELRQRRVEVPVLMLTALSEINDRVEGLEAGADDYLAKPFAFSELLARVNALSRRSGKKFQSDLHVGDLRLDPSTLEVTIYGQKIELSKKEFTLLEFLMRHEGQVVSVEQILDGAWGLDEAVTPNAVQVYIGYLRKKLNQPEIIQTVRGFGYMIKDSV